MILDAMKLSPQERLRRIQHRLCLYCGKPGHIKFTCPKAAATRVKRGHEWPRNSQPSRNNLTPRIDHRLRARGWNENLFQPTVLLAKTMPSNGLPSQPSRGLRKESRRERQDINTCLGNAGLSASLLRPQGQPGPNCDTRLVW